MTTTIYLVRHAAHDHLGKVLSGRLSDLALNDVGRAQTERLGARFAGEPIDAILSSPSARARITAASVAARLGRVEEIWDSLDEIDFGSWAGQAFEALHGDRGWTAWNMARSVTRPPNGETMLEAQARMMRAVECACGRYPEGKVVLVSHGDMIKAALAYHLGLSLDSLPRFDIDPASISTLVRGDWGAKVITMNEVSRG